MKNKNISISKQMTQRLIMGLLILVVGIVNCLELVNDTVYIIFMSLILIVILKQLYQSFFKKEEYDEMAIYYRGKANEYAILVVSVLMIVFISIMVLVEIMQINVDFSLSQMFGTVSVVFGLLQFLIGSYYKILETEINNVED